MQKKNLSISIWIVFLGLTAAANSWAMCVKSSRANLRAGPGTRYEKVWSVDKYMPLRKVGRRGRWIKVKDFEGDLSWIHSKLLTKRFRCAVVKSRLANMRSGPGTGFRKLGRVEKYYSFKVLKIKGRWAKLRDTVGDVVWIYRPLLWVN